MKIPLIMCWQAEDGTWYRDRQLALDNSPGGQLVELWGDGAQPCRDPDHSEACRGPGDVDNHVLPYLHTQTIPKLMGRILSCCGKHVSSTRSCGCSHTAGVLVEKLVASVGLEVWAVVGTGRHYRQEYHGYYANKQEALTQAESVRSADSYCYGVEVKQVRVV